MKSIDRAAKYSKASRERLQAMEDALRHLDANSIAGDVVECGVWRGGHIILARLVSPERRCWLYDTFAGMTAPGPEDVRRDGGRAQTKYDLKMDKGVRWAECSVEDVKQNMRDEGVYDHNKALFVEGDVCYTLNYEYLLPKKIALLRLDTDWYASTKKELEVLWPRLVSGGVLIVDDYNHWMGARQAVNEYLCAADRARLRPIDYTAVMMVKP